MSLRSFLRRWLGVADKAPVKRAPGFFSTDMAPARTEDDEAARRFVGGVSQRVFLRTAADFKPVAPPGMAMDSAEGREWKTATDAWDGSSLKGVFGLNNQNGVPEVQIDWYASQGFIGYQMCAILAQHWLVNKACTMPARDATRNGYEVTGTDGVVIEPKIIARLKELDKLFGAKKNAREFVRNCRIFGIRIVLFQVENNDEEYYTKPFNPDGITAGSYKGMSQVDPYWITPELDMDAASNPASKHFYEPTYWRINGKRYHRSHLIISRTNEVSDVLKPTYFYGGVSIPQMIYERVYAAERTANEAPQLALTKRSTFIHVDLAAATANEEGLEKKLTQWVYYRDNYAVKVLGTEETAEQIDTSLADFDEVVASQYGLVCAIAEVPATKMLGTQPKGFNATGEYEEASYHEMLESIQEHDVLPLLERHHLCCQRSYIMPEFSLDKPLKLAVEFNELDAETAKEKADRQQSEATRDKAYAEAGAIDGIDIRNRLIKDKDSGYSGIEAAIPEGPRPTNVIDPGAEKTAPNAPLPAEQVAPASGGNGPQASN